MYRPLRTLMLSGVSATGIALILSVPQLKAQDPETEQFPTLTTERGQAHLRAWTDGLPYVPGDVLVKFRADVSMAAQSRTLSLMRTGVETPSAVYVGEALLSHSSAEPNPEVLSAILRQQPEVEWAQPNYIDRLHSVPNDPGFSEQWNFDLMN